MAQDPDAIQREIDQTRQELAQTLDAIATKASPSGALDRGKAKARAAGGSARESVEQGVTSARQSVEHGVASAKQSVEHGVDSAKQSVEHGVDSAKQSVGQGVETARHSVESRREGSGAAAGSAAVAPVTGLRADAAPEATARHADLDEGQLYVAGDRTLRTGRVVAAAGVVAALVALVTWRRRR